jgi:hypothetical protein
MYNKKELILHTSDKSSHSMDYFELWKQIAKNFSFVRYGFDTLESKPSKEDIIKEINIKNKKHYSQIQDYKIILNNSTEYILMNKTWEYGSIFVIPDYSTPYRYFIGFLFGTLYSFSKIAGIIIYFNDIGEQIQSKTKIISCNLVNDYDLRNGQIDSSNSSFYKQTLMFT